MKPDELHRKRIQKRAENLDKKKVSPSARKSELLRKRLSRGRIQESEAAWDCNGCEMYPCGKRISDSTCVRPSKVMQCDSCGIRVRYRYITTENYRYCPVCQEMKGVLPDGTKRQ